MVAPEIQMNESSYETILKQEVYLRKEFFKFRKTYPAFIVLLLFLALSFLIWKFVADKVQSDNVAAFDKATSSVMSRTELKVQNSYQVLLSMRGLYDNLVQVVRDYFVLYGSVPVNTYPSMISLMYVPKIERQFLPEHIHFTQSQGLYNYKVFPPGDRDYYFPAAFIVPAEKNGHVSGFDFATNPITNAAIEKAQRLNKVVATLVFKFIRPDTSEFFIISPIIHKKGSLGAFGYQSDYFEGAVILELDAGQFFHDALINEVPSDTGIVFQFIDKDENNKDNIVYSSKNIGLLNSGYKPELSSVKTLTIADREMKVKFTTIPNFGGQFQHILPIISFILFLILTFGLFGFILLTTTRKAIAIDMAERMTRSQRRILESSNDIIAVLDLEGKWKSMNAASYAILGMNPEELIGKNIDSICIDSSELDDMFSNLSSFKEDFTVRMDLPMRTAKREQKWIGFSFTISGKDGMIYCIGRDVTLERIAEKEERIHTKQIEIVEQFTREASETRNYFIIKLSHQLRNSITSIIGYIQLLTQKVYQNDEEHDNYLQLATESSEDLFNYVSDIIEVVKGEEASKDISRVSLTQVFGTITKELNQENNIELTMLVPGEGAGSKTVTALADMELLKSTLTLLFRTLSIGSPKPKFQVSANQNEYEGITELQFVSNSNSDLSGLVKLYKEHKDSIFDVLKNDKEDILFNLTKIASNIRILNGSMTIDNFETENENIVQITLPLNQIKI
jgi:PAS domain S-box-containing protein